MGAFVRVRLGIYPLFQTHITTMARLPINRHITRFYQYPDSRCTCISVMSLWSSVIILWGLRSEVTLSSLSFHRAE